MATFYAKYPSAISAGSGVSTVQGEGTAGTPVGGVLTIQGDPAGTPIPISGAITATNPSVSATGAAAPAQATYVGMVVAGNLTGLPGTASGLKVDGSAVTQPVSGTVAATQSGVWNITNVSGTVSLPTGAATEATLAKLTISPTTAIGSNVGPLMMGNATNSAPTYTSSTINPLSLTSLGALRVDASGSTQPVSGTVAATQSGAWNITNISGTVSLPTGAATEVSLAKLTLAQGSTTSGQTGALVQGAVTTAAPTYTTAQSSPLSLTTGGALRVDASASTQPVSGTVAVSSIAAVTTSTAVFQAEGSLAFGSITASYQTVFTPSAATKILQMRNNTDASISVSFDAGTTLSYVLDSGDQVSLDLLSNALAMSTTAIQIKQTSGAPTSGSFRINGAH